MKKMDFNQMERTEGGKFWGWSEWSCGPCDATGHQSCVRSYSAFWIKVDYQYDYIQGDCPPVVF
ncbi:MAG: hypothetical protein J0L83_13740 [Chitinophagales bacterium]|jgi:hypothetical protein|nr:hypothetical protein [Chitinophagales bacterium]